MHQALSLNLNNPRVATWLALILLWSLIWKGFALWKAGRKGSSIWFIVLFVLNTAGILDIIYLFLVDTKKDKGEESDTNSEA